MWTFVHAPFLFGFSRRPVSAPCRGRAFVPTVLGNTGRKTPSRLLCVSEAPEEGRLISSSKYQDKLAKSICEGILGYSSVVCRKSPGNNSRVASTRKDSSGRVRTSVSGSQMGKATIGSRKQKGNKRG